MSQSKRALILKSAQDHGVLALTSYCNANCLFCSNKQNPPGIQTVSICPQKLDEIDETLEYLAPRGKIIIGESATRICEGEPFSHPEIMEILKKTRMHFPETPIQVTTNGSFLDVKTVKALKELEPLEVYLSLNSSNAEKRRNVMDDDRAEVAVQSPFVLQNFKVPYHGSLVAVPEICGFEDINQTIRLLEKCGAQTVRIFLPGYTRWSGKSKPVNKVNHSELISSLNSANPAFEIPVSVEPPYVSDLLPVTTGVIKGSPADIAGMKKGDLLHRVSGVKPWSRSDAFSLCTQKEDPKVEIVRDNERRRLFLQKKKHQNPGFVMDNDIEKERVHKAVERAKSCKAKKVLIFTSTLAKAFIKKAVEDIGGSDIEFDLKGITSEYWGGNIEAAGLLTVCDFEKAAEEFFRGGGRTELVMIPGEPFDYAGFDMLGRNYKEIEVKIQSKVVVV